MDAVALFKLDMAGRCRCRNVERGPRAADVEAEHEIDDQREHGRERRQRINGHGVPLIRFE